MSRVKLDNFTNVSEVIRDKFYFAISIGENVPQSDRRFHYFDMQLTAHEGLRNDKRVVHLGTIFEYCDTVLKILTDPNFEKQGTVLVHYALSNEKKRAYSMLLVACFRILYLGVTLQEVCDFLEKNNVSTYPIRKRTVPTTFEDCLFAVSRVAMLGFFRVDDFSMSEYDYFKQFEHGDLNWIVPQKLLAFSCPREPRTGQNIFRSLVPRRTNDRYSCITPEHYLPYFMGNHVTDVVRLNTNVYNAERFRMHGIKHHDLYFVDGGTPDAVVLRKFFDIFERAEGAVAIHCRAGLGRTGTVIAAALIKYYRFTSAEAVAWVRICRPGSIISRQYKWLRRKATMLWHDGNYYRMRLYTDPDYIPTHKYGIYSRKMTFTEMLNLDIHGKFINEENRGKLLTAHSKKKKRYGRCDYVDEDESIYHELNKRREYQVRRRQQEEWERAPRTLKHYKRVDEGPELCDYEKLPRCLSTPEMNFNGIRHQRENYSTNCSVYIRECFG